MRHGNKINHLGRKYGHRRALLANLASSLITHKRILTTVAKAKELRRYIEPLITKSKDNSTHSRRTVFSYLQDKVAVKELFEVVAAKIGDRPGGYIRIIRYQNRPGDNAEMAFIELVDFNEVYTADGKKTTTAKSKRTRRGSSPKPKVAETEVTEEVTEKVVEEEAPVVEEAVETAQEEEVPEAVEASVPEVEKPVAEVQEEEAPAVEAEPEVIADSAEEAASGEETTTEENTEEGEPKP